LTIELPEVSYPKWAVESVCLKRALTPADFRIEVSTAGSAQSVRANVIGIIENQAPTRHIRLDVPVQDGEVRADLQSDLAKAAIVERHKCTGHVSLGLVQGFGFTEPCAVASTVAHDSHHLVVVGTDDACMALAVNKLAEVGGGQVAVKNGKVVGLVELKIAGLMSTQPAEVVAQKAAGVLDGFQACGCKLNNPNMQLSLLGLVVIPELRLSDKGLVDVNRFEFIPVTEKTK
jgi:adenine deaminase